MVTWICDIETDSLLEDLTKMHCIVAREFGTENRLIGNSNNPEKMEEIVRVLEEADEIVFHNAYGFDVPALDKLYGFKPKGKVIDTLVLGRVIWPNIKDMDYGRAKAGRLPMKLVGSHSLEAYGYRLKLNKGDYGKQENAWDHWSQDMEDYCVQDVEVLHKLYELIVSKNYSPQCLELEQKFAWIISRQERHGFYFNEKAAVELLVDIKKRQDELLSELQEVFPPIMQPKNNGKPFTPKKTMRRKVKVDGKEWKNEVVGGAPHCKIHLVEFNPNSRVHIADRLQSRYGWVPEEFTGTGQPVVNEAVLGKLEYPEAKMLSEYLLLQKRLGMLSDGNQAWLKAVGKDNRIHGRVNTNGAVSGRCTHSSPNVAQVPAVYSPYGEQCRALFTVPKGKKLVGCDASGLELRGLAHFLAGFDKGEYVRKVLESDIHTENQKAAGLESRNQAKTFILIA